MLMRVLAAFLLVTINSGGAQEGSVPNPLAAGTAVFNKCTAFHQVGPNARNGIGRVLNGVVGRPAEQYPEYSYSSANKASGLIWDEPTLTRYLRAPGDVVPGTKMIFSGLKRIMSWRT